MSLIRPELRRALRHWREAIFAGVAVLAGLWILLLGGWLLQGVGGVIALAGAAYLWVAVRRARFRSGRGGPGVVQIDEGRIGYFGPFHGGSVSLGALTAIRLVTDDAGRARWYLHNSEGTTLLIPANAEGARLLFDAFAALPGVDAARLVAISRDTSAGDRLVWRRPDGDTRAIAGGGGVGGGDGGGNAAGRPRPS